MEKPRSPPAAYNRIGILPNVENLGFAAMDLVVAAGADGGLRLKNAALTATHRGRLHQENRLRHSRLPQVHAYSESVCSAFLLLTDFPAKL